jgi:hypothetical protein
MAGKRVKRYKAKPCRNCQKVFEPITSWQVDCCDDCHNDFWKDKNPMARIAKIEARLAALEKSEAVNHNEKRNMV